MPDDAKPQPHVPPETRGRHKTVVVAAAEWHLRALVRAAIENKRTQVVEAATLAALSAVARSTPLDLVILDAGVVLDAQPVGEAHAARHTAWADTPLVLLTDPTVPDDAPALAAIQPDRTLHKHFSPFELLHIVYALTGY